MCYSAVCLTGRQGARRREATRICYFGTYERDYPGNRVLIEGLRQRGVDVVECHTPLWEKTRRKDKSYFKLRSLIGLSGRYLLACMILLWRVSRLGSFDAILVGFNGHTDLFLARLVATCRRVPLIFNPMLSIYDTLVIDRQYFSRDALPARLLLMLERILCKLPDAVFLDASEHFRLFHDILGVPRAKFRQLYFGADDKIFYPRPSRQPDGSFRVLFYGKFQPLQGVEHIVRAAHLLRDYKDIKFKVIGSGPDSQRVKAIVRQLAIQNVEFLDWVPFGELQGEIANADVCLGIFGTTNKVRRCIANKVIQALAMARPVVTGLTQASQELLKHEQEVLFTEPGNSEAIASAILRLRADASLRANLAANGYRLFQLRCSPRAIGNQAYQHFVELLSNKRGALRTHSCSLPSTGTIGKCDESSGIDAGMRVEVQRGTQ